MQPEDYTLFEHKNKRRKEGNISAELFKQKKRRKRGNCPKIIKNRGNRVCTHHKKKKRD